MDGDEPYLRPCKQLPSPTNDRQALHVPMGQHLGTQSASQGQLDQRSHETSPNTAQEDSEDDASEFEEGSSKDAFEHLANESSEEKVARLLKGKEIDWAAAAQKKGPLRLLDLPLDVLKIILKEVTHTNDLANCAKVNSALHSIVTPMIYSRFDIVWPDTLSTTEPARGVDALTYGLATLVMREDLFENVLYPNNTPCGASCQSFSCPHCGSISYLSKDLDDTRRPRSSRRGNYFSQFVKKFSLGNGPAEWVQEYLVTKESGKMLGTLVALSIARMPNLESFVWDMPTGILRDIWIALSSLLDHQRPKLTKLWVRFHDNHAALKDAGLLQSTVTAQTTQSVPGAVIALPPTQQPSLTDPEQYGVRKIVWIDHHIEKPNFSIMPALSSLTVLDIDEVQYLQELTVLLARSLTTLRHLRIGMAGTLNIPPSAQHNSELGPLFSGGVFSLLMSKIYDQTKAMSAPDLYSSRHEDICKGENTNLEAAGADPSTVTSPLVGIPATNIGNGNPDDPEVEESESRLSSLAAEVANVALDAIDPALFGENPPVLDVKDSPGQSVEKDFEDGKLHDPPMSDEQKRLKADTSSTTDISESFYATEKLKLEVLEIERLTKLTPSVLCKAIDFTMLTSLTLLQCGDRSSLWDLLRKEFAPRFARNTKPTTKGSGQPPHVRRKQSSEPSTNDMEYRLRLKRIHTDAVSSDLISFLKNTLAPNSLEWLFLQDTEHFPSPVTLEAIYRGPIRRHRSSLTKVMIDSAYGPPTRAHTNAARKWMLNRDILTFITSGKMCKLRELAVALEYKDWHFFLQRLPNIPHLRSLYVPNMSDHPYGNSLNVKDFALGAIDVVALRPEVELCYLGIKNKCFEILERKHKDKPKGHAPGQTPSATDTASDDDTEDGDHHDDDDDSDDGGTATAPPPPAIDPGAMDSDTGSITSEDDEEEEGKDGAAKEKNKVRLKLREILFYDDKISIFKARHGRL